VRLFTARRLTWVVSFSSIAVLLTLKADQTVFQTDMTILGRTKARVIVENRTIFPIETEQFLMEVNQE
jgi:hypothetical protein